ncbi:hypothetical protein BS17DRAFT_788273, partial [Gyrodon lividus]
MSGMKSCFNHTLAQLSDKSIVVLTLPTNDFFGDLSGRQLALALITPWDTQGNIASKDD